MISSLEVSDDRDKDHVQPERRPAAHGRLHVEAAAVCDGAGHQRDRCPRPGCRAGKHQIDLRQPDAIHAEVRRGEQGPQVVTGGSGLHQEDRGRLPAALRDRRRPQAEQPHRACGVESL